MASITARIAGVAAMVLAVIFGLGSLLLLAFTPHEVLPIMRLSGGGSWPLVWDAALSLLFFVQHSGMNRRGARAYLARLIPAPYHGAVYSIASGVALAVVVILWQPSGKSFFTVQGPARWAVYLLCVLSLGGFAWGALALMAFDPLGLRPLRAHLHGQSAPPLRLVVRGPYRWVRHPLYSCAILLIWSSPELSPDRLLFDVLWTAWICVGAVLEERDLLDDFGGTYREYRQRVPMLVPWRRPVAPLVQQPAGPGR